MRVPWQRSSPAAQLPWQRSSSAIAGPLATQPTSGQLSAVLLRPCAEPSCPHYQEPRTGAEKPCEHAVNIDQGVVASFGDVLEKTVAFQATGTNDAIKLAAMRVADAMDDLEREGGEHAARLQQRLQELYFEVRHSG